MTLKALEAQARKLKLLEGEECVRARTGAYYWAVLLDFVKRHPPDDTGYREPEKGIVVECSWRLENESEVIVGSGDNDSSVDLKLQECVERRVLSTEVFLPSYSACIRFEGGLIIWIFPDDSKDYAKESEYPRSPWYLTGRAIPPGWEE